MKNDYKNLMNHHLRRALLDVLRLSGREIRAAFALLRAFAAQLIAVLRRTRWERRGVHVPPYMIASVTGQCTMQCAHCYAKDLPRRQGTEMTSSEWQAVFCQAKELGIGIIFIAGGEPFMRTDVIEVMARFPGTLFPVFTNGMLLKGSMMNMLRR